MINSDRLEEILIQVLKYTIRNEGTQFVANYLKKLKISMNDIYYLIDKCEQEEPDSKNKLVDALQIILKDKIKKEDREHVIRYLETLGLTEKEIICLMPWC